MRLGAHLALSPQSDLLASYIDTDRDEFRTQVFPDGTKFDAAVDENGYQAEAQYLFRGNRFKLIGGLAKYDIDRKEADTFDFTGVPNFPCPPFLPSCEVTSSLDSSLTRDSAYLYGQFAYPTHLLWTLGLSYDDLNEGGFSQRQWNPKFGLQWNIDSRNSVRLALFRTIKPALAVEQTLEPTEIAGFNQFFDDVNASRATRYAIAYDTRIGGNLYAGVEASYRDIKAPSFDPSGNVDHFEDFDENQYGAYFYWMLNDRWSLTVEPEYQKFKRTGTIGDAPVRLETTLLPLTIRYADTSGFLASIGGTYVLQDVERPTDSALKDGRDGFFLLNAMVGYRLPKRYGVLSIEALNILDQEFAFQDNNFQNSEPTNPRFIPDRLLFFRFSINF